MKCFWMALLLEMIPLVQKNWIPQRVGLEDRVSKKLPQAGVLVLNTCYLGPLFLASDVTCRKQIKEKKKKKIKERHFFFMCVKRVLGLRIEGQPLSLMSLIRGAHVPDSYPWEVSLVWLDSLMCQPQLELLEMALLLYQASSSHEWQNWGIPSTYAHCQPPWSEGLLCRILLRRSNTCKPPNINADWRLMVRICVSSSPEEQLPLPE